MNDIYFYIIRPMILLNELVEKYDKYSDELNTTFYKRDNAMAEVEYLEDSFFFYEGTNVDFDILNNLKFSICNYTVICKVLNDKIIRVEELILYLIKKYDI